MRGPLCVVSLGEDSARESHLLAAKRKPTDTCQQKKIHLQLSPEQVNEVCEPVSWATKILDLINGVPNSVLQFESNQLAANPRWGPRGVASAYKQRLMFGISMDMVATPVLKQGQYLQGFHIRAPCHLRVYWQELLDLHMEMGLNIEEALMYSSRDWILTSR
ncbi:[Pyruvate dehydrogenase [acetyl-transferring]]-phosphatase 2; mitochondrial [Camelus dromedarius]|uniref:[Pyruvate dehydrogenase [acetyl-transferring]]-phosphatase 2 n=1 Tax=Camelus dromedarius TaxID=9838 RepID=A0A5N4DPU4_CAMDR|nr:[Pyruvate dehydrogenase [acetyl-transferring]]-phosphatase 2; mitochondrial [Camelus dromedarius]